MQRTPSVSRIINSNEHCVINIRPESPVKLSPTTMMRSGKFPNNGKKNAWISRAFTSKNSIHAVPFVVFLCIFILWWFSYPVNLVIRDGQIKGINSIKTTSLPVSEYRFDHTILALSARIRARFLGNPTMGDNEAMQSL